MLPSMSFQEFQAQGQEFIEREGRQLASADLQDLIARSHRDIAVDANNGLEVSENLFRHSAARCDISWSGARAEDGARMFGSSWQVRFAPPHWHLVGM